MNTPTNAIRHPVWQSELETALAISISTTLDEYYLKGLLKNKNVTNCLPGRYDVLFAGCNLLSNEKIADISIKIQVSESLSSGLGMTM